MAINIGDTVNIKSDKVNKMTVLEKTDNTCTCIWFDVTIELQTHEFKNEVLEVSDSE